MPKDERNESKADRRIAFLADRLAVLMAELTARDLEYGDFCHDEFYKLKRVRDNRFYPVCLDFVRNMLRRHDDDSKRDRQD